MGTLGPLPCCYSGGQAGLVAGGGVHGAAVAVCQSPTTTTPGRSAGTKGGNLLCESISTYLYLLITINNCIITTTRLFRPFFLGCFLPKQRKYYFTHLKTNVFDLIRTSGKKQPNETVRKYLHYGNIMPLVSCWRQKK